MRLKCERGQPYEYKDVDTGKAYYSVSQVLFTLDPDAFTGIDLYVLAAAQDRGKDLHLIFALWLLSRLNLAARPDRPSGLLGGYYDALEKFMQERKPVPIKVEQSSINDKEGYAGTADTECTLDGKPEHSLIDLKTGPPRAVHAAQLHAYKKMEGYEKVKRIHSLYITKLGTYTLIEHTTSHIDWSWFQSGLNVLNGRRYHKIL